MLTKLDRADGIAVLKFGLFSKLSVFRALGTFEIKSESQRLSRDVTEGINSKRTNI